MDNKVICILISLVSFVCLDTVTLFEGRLGASFKLLRGMQIL